MYKMTVKELYETLMARRKGLAYKIWRGANMVARAVWDSQRYPSTPKDAMPELFPQTSIKMPDFLRDEWAKKMGGS